MKITEEKHNKSVGKLIGMLSRAAHIYFQQKFKDYSIGHAQVMTLHFITKKNGISQLELTRILNLDKSSVTSQLNNLEKHGYIIRTVSDDDNRIRNIHITEKTKAIENSLHKVFTSWSEILLTGFDETEQTEMIYLLEKMRENALNKINDIKLDVEKK